MILIYHKLIKIVYKVKFSVNFYPIWKGGGRKLAILPWAPAPLGPALFAVIVVCVLYLFQSISLIIQYLLSLLPYLFEVAVSFAFK